MIPIPHLGQASAHPNEAMNSIQIMPRTLGAIRYSSGCQLLRRQPVQLGVDQRLLDYPANPYRDKMFRA